MFLTENNEISNDTIQCVSWSNDGNMIAISGKDRKIRIFDVRTNSIQKEAENHQNMRDSRVLFVNKDYLLTSGWFFEQNIIKSTY